jgi:cation:H+ antiporter
MVDLAIWIPVFIVSILVLIKAAEYFTKSAEQIGLAFRLPQFIIGVTIVAIGTSLPEIISSVFAVVRNSSEIVIGNVIGSNVANIFLVLGTAVLVSKKLILKYNIIHIDLPLLLGSTFLLVLTTMDGIFNIYEGILCLCGFFVYILHAVTAEKEIKKITMGKIQKENKKRVRLRVKPIIILILSGFFIYIGAKYSIESVIALSELLTVGKEAIAASAVAIGTSLPEMIVSITAARKGNPEIAIGNILGSNIFNVLAVMGIPVLFGPIHIPQNMITFGLPILIIATFLFTFMAWDREIRRFEGCFLIIFYAFFIGKLFNIF